MMMGVAFEAVAKPPPVCPCGVNKCTIAPCKAICDPTPTTTPAGTPTATANETPVSTPTATATDSCSPECVAGSECVKGYLYDDCTCLADCIDACNNDGSCPVSPPTPTATGTPVSTPTSTPSGTPNCGLAVCDAPQVCDTSLGYPRCVDCRVQSDCVDPEHPWCDTSTNECKECGGDQADRYCRDMLFWDGSTGNGVCSDAFPNTCVECKDNYSCPRASQDSTRRICKDQTRCVECENDGNCESPKKCDLVEGTVKSFTCYECKVNGDCKDNVINNKTTCDTENRVCVESSTPTATGTPAGTPTATGTPVETPTSTPDNSCGNTNCVEPEICLDAANNECGACSSEYPDNCGAGLTCDVNSKTCVECLDNTQCACSLAGPHCDTSSHTCTECTDDNDSADCNNGTSEKHFVCNMTISPHACVECTVDGDCTVDPKRHCDTETWSCVAESQTPTETPTDTPTDSGGGSGGGGTMPTKTPTATPECTRDAQCTTDPKKICENKVCVECVTLPSGAPRGCPSDKPICEGNICKGASSTPTTTPTATTGGGGGGECQCPYGCDGMGNCLNPPCYVTGTCVCDPECVGSSVCIDTNTCSCDDECIDSCNPNGSCTEATPTPTETPTATETATDTPTATDVPTDTPTGTPGNTPECTSDGECNMGINPPWPNYCDDQRYGSTFKCKATTCAILDCPSQADKPICLAGPPPECVACKKDTDCKDASGAGAGNKVCVNNECVGCTSDDVCTRDTTNYGNDYICEYDTNSDKTYQTCVRGCRVEKETTVCSSDPKEICAYVSNTWPECVVGCRTKDDCQNTSGMASSIHQICVIPSGADHGTCQDSTCATDYWCQSNSAIGPGHICEPQGPNNDKQCIKGCRLGGLVTSYVCPTGQVCKGSGNSGDIGQCENTPTPTPSPSPSPSTCMTDSSCTGGQKCCMATKQCMDNICTTDNCGVGKTCHSYGYGCKICVEGCHSNANCPSGQVCDGGSSTALGACKDSCTAGGLCDADEYCNTSTGLCVPGCMASQCASKKCTSAGNGGERCADCGPGNCPPSGQSSLNWYCDQNDSCVSRNATATPTPAACDDGTTNTNNCPFPGECIGGECRKCSNINCGVYGCKSDNSGCRTCAGTDSNNCNNATPTPTPVVCNRSTCPLPGDCVAGQCYPCLSTNCQWGCTGINSGTCKSGP